MHAIIVFHHFFIVHRKTKLVRDLHLTEYEEEIDAFFASEIADSVRKYQLESSEDMTPSAGGESDHIERFAQSVLVWTAGRSRAEILQRLKYQPKTKQFMFVSGELPVDATVAAMFLRAAHPSQKNPLCFKGTARKFLSAKATMHDPPITEVRKSHT